jgi:PAS domain S-box-containing protein
LHINEPTLDKFQANLYPSVEDRGYYYLSEFEMMKKDGNIFATENTVFPLQDERGIRIGWVSVIRDITKRKFANEALQKAHDELERRVEERTAELVTSNEMLNQEVAERKQAEEALREDSEQLQKLSEASFDGVVIMEKGVIQAANQTFADLYGYELSEIIGMDALDFISPESKDIVLNKIIAGYEKRYEATVQKKEGKKFEVEACGAAITYKGRPARITAMRDITKRKQAEEALKESEVKHKTLVHNIPGMVYRGYTDWSAEIISGSEEICGYTNKELNSEKESWLSIIHPDDKAKVFMKGSELAKRKQNIVQTYRIVTKGGDNRWVEDWKTSLFTEEGEFIGIDGIVVDITKRKRTEEALQKIHVELEQRVEKRTRELEVQKTRLRFLSAQLINAQEQERRRVSKGLHDEMGQALAILKLRLRSIQRDFPEGQSTLKEEFDDTAQHVDQIIETVRRLSKDLSPAILEDLGLSSALEWLIENFGKQHSIRTSVEMVNIDHLFSQETQTNLYRIFQEALTNIIKHARAGHVSFVVKKEEKGSVFFLIKDNGKGFDVNEAVAVDIVERGIGLTAMNERAHMMGAILDIQSRPGEGTRITLEISA